MPSSKPNCRKNEIRILFRSRDSQVDRLKWDTLYIQDRAFKVLQVIISESMRRIKNKFRQKFCESKEDIR